jgi:hypothetical protein
MFLSRWLVVKDTCVFYLRLNDGRIGDVMLMDRDFNVVCGEKDTGENYGLLIQNLSRYEHSSWIWSQEVL